MAVDQGWGQVVAPARAATVVAEDREAAFTRFYAETYGELARYAGRLTGDPALGDELAQEAMARVFARWLQLGTPRPYAYRAVHNLAQDHWRRRGREARLGTAAEPQTVPGPDTSVRDAVDRLPDRLRSVVVLHYFADLPLAEVARVLRRPVGTVGRRLSEARALLSTTCQEER